MIMLFNQLLDMPHLSGGWIILAEKCSLKNAHSNLKQAFCEYGRFLGSFISAHETWNQHFTSHYIFVKMFLKSIQVGCSGSDQLPSSLQLPCVRILKATWDHKSLQQKRAEVRGALGVLLDGVGRVRKETKLSCQSSLLERLEHGITNYLHIVTKLDIKGDLTDPDPGCPSQQSRSLTQVLQLYGRLLRGKLEWLSLDLRDSCLDQS
ncbi:uncharacterized protein LOC129831825 isoform X1 [Salvelinus fontinalis]|uniref:uncharacterized protein LOC129831825 isoform X1 n=1 Tax=Salvelinus fontinalis TaxID=8038 RepID=UPI00248687B0|nr:uncharacterized protein LOC129831825 isoform X1 [Salvelinus fontinalis]